MSVASRAGGLIGRMGPLAVAIAAAMWATDPYFRPELTKQLTASHVFAAGTAGTLP